MSHSKNWRKSVTVFQTLRCFYFDNFDCGHLILFCNGEFSGRFATQIALRAHLQNKTA
jgi:hypothetical protein